MKLQTKINYRFLSLLLGVFVVAGIALYFALGYVVDDYIDETLSNKRKDIEEILTLKNDINLINDSINKTTIYEPTKIEIKKKKSDTIIYDKHEKEMVDYRMLSFTKKVDGKIYKISLIDSKLETEDQVEMIFYFMIILFAIIVCILFFLNRWLSASIWKPFYKTIDQIKSFRISQKGDVIFEESTIYEFNILEKTLQNMIQSAQSEYCILKEFTENASHEIQTPMAIIQSKLESVLQDKTLSSERYEQIQSAYETISRLSKLNEALLLLTKIENQQFPDTKEINFYALIKDRLEFIAELIEFKELTIKFNTELEFKTKINPYLAEILVNNLLGNAIKHNIKNGEIQISCKQNQLSISNSGETLTIPPEKLFQRFIKHNSKKDSTGLGLAIAYEICEKSNLKLEYNYQEKFHHLTISRNS